MTTFKKFDGTTPFRPDLKPEKVEKTKKYRIPPRSEKRIKENAEYLILKEEFLKDKICPVTGGKAVQVHHKKGRRGKLFLDVSFWLGVSAKGHDKIERNPEWAYQMGYSLKRIP